MRTSVRLVQGTDIARLSRGYSGARAEFASPRRRPVFRGAALWGILIAAIVGLVRLIHG